MKLKEDKAELKEQLDTVLKDNRAMKRLMLELFAKVYEVDDLNDLENLTVNKEFDSSKTDKELEEYNKRENEKIQNILKIKRKLE